jgi:GH25 family lysozyme M1 (1,4-beta-N-acetylmuramidase)
MGTTTIRAATANGKTSTFTVTVLAEELNKNGAIIDISEYNPVSDWGVLSKNVAFVILRCGVTYSTSHERAGEMDSDDRFSQYATRCIENGIPFGVYYFGRASTPEKARLEAEKAYAIASKYHPLFYAYDAEASELTGDSIEAFGDTLRDLGVRKVGCYIAHHQYKRYGVDTSKFDFIWIPHYGDNTGDVDSTPSYKCDLHQYSSRGRVKGMSDTTVDVNRLMGRKPLSFFTS